MGCLNIVGANYKQYSGISDLQEIVCNACAAVPTSYYQNLLETGQIIWLSVSKIKEPILIKTVFMQIYKQCPYDKTI